MPALYNVIAGGKHIAVVRGVPALFVGDFWSEVNDLLIPDSAAIRAALPHFWRKAFDRAGGHFWHRDGTKRPHLTLHTTRGKALTTIMCEGYWQVSDQLCAHKRRM